MPQVQYTNLNKIVENWLRRFLWLWLPFYALGRLVKAVIAKHETEKTDE